MTDREAFAWAIGAMVDGADMLPVFKTVALLREAARLIAESGALPVRCDNAAKLFRQMIAEEASCAPIQITDEMISAYRDESAKVAARQSNGSARSV